MSLEDVKALVEKREQPFLVEAHLPGIMSVDLIDRIYVSDKFKGMSALLSKVKDKVQYVRDSSEIPVALSSSVPVGYSFRAHPGHMHVIPNDVGLRDDDDDQKEIRFAVRGENGVVDFAVTLLAKDGAWLTFMCRPFDDAVYVYNCSLPKIIKDYPELPPPIRVNRYFCKNIMKPDMYCTITLSKGGTVQLAHSGLSELTNPESLTVDAGDFPYVDKLKCLIFSSMEYATTFTNIRIN